jgi:hypothetical protein
LKIGFFQRSFKRHIQVIKVEIVEGAELINLGEDPHKFLESKKPHFSEFLKKF